MSPRERLGLWLSVLVVLISVIAILISVYTPWFSPHSDQQTIQGPANKTIFSPSMPKATVIEQVVVVNGTGTTVSYYVVPVNKALDSFSISVGECKW
jgi:hypothetical protein